MSVLDPRELQASPLADLHALASELGLEGFRRLRKDDLIKQIVEAQGGTYEAPAPADPDPDPEPEEPEVALAEEAAPEPEAPAEEFRAPGAPEDNEEDLHEGSAAEFPRDYQESMPNWEKKDGADEGAEEREEDMRSGVLDVLPNGSGFIRAEPYRQSREDVYVSPAQIRRCDLRPGDEVSGPGGPPGRKQRHPSLVRVARVNGQDADSPAERARFDKLVAAWPTE